MIIIAHVDTSGMMAALEEFAATAGADMKEVIVKQSGILVGHLIAATPPGKSFGKNMNDRGGIDNRAKKTGEYNIESDIRKIFPTTAMAADKVAGLIANNHLWKTKRGTAAAVRDTAWSIADLKRIHRCARSRKTGRTRKFGGANMAVTRASLLSAYIREEKRKVGKLSGGWVEAAENLGTSKRATPAWITRHSGSNGNSTIRSTDVKTEVDIENYNDWFPGNMDYRIQDALNRREHGLIQATRAMIARKELAATRRMARSIVRKII